MKFISITVLSLMISMAHASTEYKIQCSNSNATVKWESGDNTTNTISLKNIKEGTMTLDLRHVRINFKVETTLDVQETNVCGLYKKTHIYAGKVHISPSSEYPRDLTRVSESNEIETEVLCKSELKSTVDC